MFPHSIAEGPFSLRLGEEGCCALSIGVDLAADGSIAKAMITPSRIRVSRRASYIEVAGVLEDETLLRQQQDLHELHKVSISELGVAIWT